MLADSGLVGSTELHGRGAARAEDDHGTPTQSHISPSILAYGDNVEIAIENFLTLRGPQKDGGYGQGWLLSTRVGVMDAACGSPPL